MQPQLKEISEHAMAIDEVLLYDTSLYLVNQTQSKCFIGYLKRQLTQLAQGQGTEKMKTRHIKGKALTYLNTV